MLFIYDATRVSGHFNWLLEFWTKNESGEKILQFYKTQNYHEIHATSRSFSWLYSEQWKGKILLCLSWNNSAVKYRILLKSGLWSKWIWDSRFLNRIKNIQDVSQYEADKYTPCNRSQIRINDMHPIFQFFIL